MLSSFPNEGWGHNVTESGGGKDNKKGGKTSDLRRETERQGIRTLQDRSVEK